MRRLLLLLFILSVQVGVLSHSFGQVIAVNSVKEKDPTFTVKANYPNPFQEQTTISFYISRPQVVRITLYNIVGSKITGIIDEAFEAGEHEVVFKRPDNLPDGIYIYTVEAGTSSRSMRMIIRK